PTVPPRPPRLLPSCVLCRRPPPTALYPLSLHDALPILSRLPVGSSARISAGRVMRARATATRCCCPPDSSEGFLRWWPSSPTSRSEEHTSELQSRENLVCRLLLEKKKNVPAPH